MRKIQLTWIILIVSIMLLTLPHVLLAGRSGTEAPGTAPPIATDPTAKGTTFEGVLGIHYEMGSCTCIAEFGPNVSMTFFMRLETNKNVYPFGGYLHRVCYWDFNAQQVALESYIKSTVVPFLYEQGLIATPNACFAFKDVSKVVDDTEGDFDDPLKPAFTCSISLWLSMTERSVSESSGGWRNEVI